MGITYSTGSETYSENAIMAIVSQVIAAPEAFNEECLYLTLNGWILQGSPFSDATNLLAMYYKRSKKEDSERGANAAPVDVRLV